MNYELVDAKYVKNFVVWYGSMTVVEGKPRFVPVKISNPISRRSVTVYLYALGSEKGKSRVDHVRVHSGITFAGIGV